ncbi:MAG: hypothetical protein ACK5CT_04925 [Bacteroidota bacterium]|jgi:hypothetical protein
MHRRLFRWIFTFSAILSGCSTDDDTPVPMHDPSHTDYRDPVIGLYTGTRNQYSWAQGNPPVIFDSTWAYSFSVVKDTAYNRVIADGEVFTLDSNLSFYEMPTPGFIRSFSFSNDSVTLFFRSSGLGGYGSTTITGLKQ